MRIATSIPDVLHICPECDEHLASGAMLCTECLIEVREYLAEVEGGDAPAAMPGHPMLASEAVEMRDALAPLLTLPGIRPELGAPVERVRCERQVISTPYRGNGFVNLLWMLGAASFAVCVLGVLGVYQLFHDWSLRHEDYR